MNLYSQIDQLEQIHHHVEHKCTGNAETFAGRLHVFRRTLYRILAQLKDREVSIVYSRTRGCFIYTSEQKIPDLIKRITRKF